MLFLCLKLPRDVLEKSPGSGYADVGQSARDITNMRERSLSVMVMTEGGNCCCATRLRVLVYPASLLCGGPDGVWIV